MYAGSPVVAVASGGPLETVRDGETGFLRPGTAEGFADAMARMVRDPGLKATMGRAGHTHVRECFGLDAFSRTLEAAVRQAVQFYRHGHKEERVQGSRGRLMLVLLLVVVVVVVMMGAGLALGLLVLLRG